MFVDSRLLNDGQPIDAEVCIIGAGAAGISIARQLASYGHRVCLLESGGLGYDQATQSLYRGDNIGNAYDPLDACRLRFFGGTTNHWAGWTRPLDPIDFEKRDWVANSGWPITRDELEPFYKRAEPVLQLGPHSYEPEYWCDGDCADYLLDQGALQSRVFRFSPPTRFGQTYRDEIGTSELIQVYLNANVVNIELNPNGSAVDHLRIAILEGDQYTVKADTFILAAGGIENARLLLSSNNVQKQGIGNRHDLVGRYFSDHIGVLGGAFVSTKPNNDLRFYRQHHVAKTNADTDAKIRGALSLNFETVRREQLSNFGCLVSQKSWPFIAKNTFSRHVGAVISSVDDMLVDGYRALFAPEKRAELLEMIIISESTPNPDSRVSLTNEKDALGVNRVKLDWRLAAQDREMIKKIRHQLALEFGRANAGRVLLEEDDIWPPEWSEYGRHHMGTTRMHTDPRLGVVDVNCRVHDMQNLYVSGSSVFTTYGYAQPTFTIVALALRLADHISNEVLV